MKQENGVDEENYIVNDRKQENDVEQENSVDKENIFVFELELWNFCASSYIILLTAKLLF